MTRSAAILTVLAGAAFMSFAGLSLRFIENAGPFEVLVYRSFALGSVVPFIAMARRRCSFVEFFKTLVRRDWIMGVMMAAAFSFYIYSILTTSVASTLFILASAPFFAAVIGWAWVGEKPKPLTWLMMIFAMIGVAVMVFDGVGEGRLLGNVFAVISAICFAVSLVYVRFHDGADMLGGTFLGGWMASAFNAVLALALGISLVISANDAMFALISGVFTIGIGMALVIWGASFLPAAEVSIYVLIESVMGPLWVWMVFREEVSPALLIGGAIVMVSVAVQAWYSRPRGAAAYQATQ